MKVVNVIIAIAFIVVGVLFVRSAFTRPCEVEPITQEIAGQTIEVNQPMQLDKLLCLSTDYVSLVLTLIGTAMIFPGVGGLFKGLTDDSEGGKGKKKKKKKK